MHFNAISLIDKLQELLGVWLLSTSQSNDLILVQFPLYTHGCTDDEFTEDFHRFDTIQYFYCRFIKK